MSFQQFSSYCATALPFLGMIYTAMLIYDARSDRWQLCKQVLSFVFFAALAYIRVVVP
jgi:hypothetical protein